MVPNDFLNMEMNALGVLEHDSIAACVTFAPSAKSRIEVAVAIAKTHADIFPE